MKDGVDKLFVRDTPTGPWTSGEYSGSAYDLWSDPDTWASTLGHVPLEGEDVTIEVGRQIALDVETPALGELIIEGELAVLNDGGTYALTCDKIHLEGDGIFRCGTETTDEFIGHFTLTLADTTTDPTDAHYRGIMIHDNAQMLFSAEYPIPFRTKLNAHADASDTVLTLAESSNWQIGDEVVIGSTDLYDFDEPELRTLADASGTSITLSSGLTNPKWGSLQYATDVGLSETPGTFTPPSVDVPTVVDQRAMMVNLTRRIVIQGADDAVWASDHEGGHIMVMDNTTNVRMKGVRWERMGQAGRTGRYPIHWHVCSFEQVGWTFTAAMPDNQAYLEGCVFTDTANRAVVYHSTWNIHSYRCIAYDTHGHPFFIEDATEEENSFVECVAIKCQGSYPGKTLMEHETGTGEVGPTGFWITNPNNDVIDCWANYTDGPGFWWSIPQTAINLSDEVDVEPNRIMIGTVDGNEAIGCLGPGASIRNGVVDNSGNTNIQLQYIPTDDETASGTPLEFNVDGFKINKCQDGAYRNNVGLPHYRKWQTADNYGRDLVGKTLSFDGLQPTAEDCLLVGHSLNNAHNEPASPPFDADTRTRTGIATYHSTLSPVRCVFMHFPTEIDEDESFVGGAAATYGTGAMTADDYYIEPVEMGLYWAEDNQFIDAFVCYRNKTSHMMPTPPGNRNFCFSGAIKDWHGYLGPAGWYWVYDLPFFTAGAGGTGDAVECDGYAEGTNGRVIEDKFYGVRPIDTNFDNESFVFYAPLTITRQDSGGSTIGDPWVLEDGLDSILLGQFRHFAARVDGRYKIEYHEDDPPTWFHWEITNCHEVGDSVLLGFEMDGATSITSAKYYCGSDSAPYRRTLSSAASIAAVLAGSGDLYYFDTANDLFWVKIVGGLTAPGGMGFTTPGYYNNLYNPYQIKVNT